MTFSDESTAAVRVLWEASYYARAERMQLFIGELADLLVGHEQQELEPGVRELLDQASVSTVERQLVARRI